MSRHGIRNPDELKKPQAMRFQAWLTPIMSNKALQFSHCLSLSSVPPWHPHSVNPQFSCHIWLAVCTTHITYATWIFNETSFWRATALECESRHVTSWHTNSYKGPQKMNHCPGKCYKESWCWPVYWIKFLEDGPNECAFKDLWNTEKHSDFGGRGEVWRYNTQDQPQGRPSDCLQGLGKILIHSTNTQGPSTIARVSEHINGKATAWNILHST